MAFTGIHCAAISKKLWIDGGFSRVRLETVATNSLCHLRIIRPI